MTRSRGRTRMETQSGGLQHHPLPMAQRTQKVTYVPALHLGLAGRCRGKNIQLRVSGNMSPVALLCDLPPSRPQFPHRILLGCPPRPHAALTCHHSFSAGCTNAATSI